MTTVGEVPPISAGLLRLFRAVARSYFRRHFRSVMVQNADYLAHAEGPLVVYANHSSWWDPMVCVLLAESLRPSLKHYAPMDATALGKYRLFAKLGMFPVTLESVRGAALFLRTAQAILSSGGVLWITPQGRFADPREPLLFKAGLGALASRVPGLTLLPLAIEYPFWDERLPETLLRFGTPIQLPAGIAANEATAALESALAETMAELKTAAVARDPKAFNVLLEGGRGTGGFYAIGRWLRSFITGKRLDPDHTPRHVEAQRKTDREGS